MERKRQIPGPNGNLMNVTEVGYRPSGEYWNEYLLDDGTVARLRLIVTSVYRVDGKVDSKGQPVYMIESKNVVAISAGEGGSS